MNRLLQLERHHVKTRQMEYEEKRRARQEAALEAAKTAEMQIEKMMPKWWTLGDLQVGLAGGGGGEDFSSGEGGCSHIGDGDEVSGGGGSGGLRCL